MYVILDYPRWYISLAKFLGYYVHKETRHTEIRSFEGNIGVLLDALCRNEMKNHIGLQEQDIGTSRHAARDNSSEILSLLRINYYL